MNKKGIEVSAWIVGLILVLMAAVVVILFMSGVIGNANQGASNLSNTASNIWNDPCSRAKLYINSNPNEACKILCNANICSNSNNICDCGDLCIKCDCNNVYFPYLGTC